MTHSIQSGLIAGVLLGLLLSPALAQNSGVNASATPPEPGSYTKDSVSPSVPFGDIKVTPQVTASAQSIRSFNQTLSLAQQTELRGRCAVINANKDSYDANALAFCRSYVNMKP